MCKRRILSKEEFVVEVNGELTLAELYMSHNGGVDKVAIAKDIGADNPQLYTDSHLYLKLLTRKLGIVKLGDLPRRLATVIGETLDYVKSALDLNLLVIAPHSEPLLICVGYVRNKEGEIL